MEYKGALALNSLQIKTENDVEIVFEVIYTFSWYAIFLPKKYAKKMPHLFFFFLEWPSHLFSPFLSSADPTSDSSISGPQRRKVSPPPPPLFSLLHSHLKKCKGERERERDEEVIYVSIQGTFHRAIFHRTATNRKSGP